MNNNNEIALVTGGSRGLGKDMAVSLAKRGVNVLFTYNSKKDEAHEVVAQLEQYNVRAAALQLDVTSIKNLNSFVEKVQHTLKETFNAGKINYLVNNAGTSLHAPITDTTEEQFDEVVNVHFKSVYFLTQKLLPLITDGGGIVNISSGLTRFSGPGSSAYAAVKGAIEVFTRYLAVELGKRGIRANTVAPGAIATDFSGGMVRDNPEINARIASLTPLGRVGEADDIGSVIAFLCSPDAKWVNGQRLEVSGGMLA